MQRNLSQNIKDVLAFAPASITTNTTTNGEVIDTRGYNSCMFTLTGKITDGTYTPLIQESDVSTFGGEQNNVDDADLQGTEAAAALIADSDGKVISKIGYKGAKRYVRLSYVSTAVATSGGVLSASAQLGNANQRPVT